MLMRAYNFNKNNITRSFMLFLFYSREVSRDFNSMIYYIQKFTLRDFSILIHYLNSEKFLADKNIILILIFQISSPPPPPILFFTARFIFQVFNLYSIKSKPFLSQATLFTSNCIFHSIYFWYQSLLLGYLLRIWHIKHFWKYLEILVLYWVIYWFWFPKTLFKDWTLNWINI